MATPDPYTPSIQELAAQHETERRQRNIIIWATIIAIVLLGGVGTVLFFLFRPETSAEEVGRIRDVFLIFMALESLIIGVALVVLIVQIASLINLLQNEVRPILKATNETVNTLRGTAEFLGENVVQPVIKLNGYMAGLQRVLELMGIKRN